MGHIFSRSTGEYSKWSDTDCLSAYGFRYSDDGRGCTSVFTATEGKFTARSLRFAPLLSATGWKAFGMPFTSAVIKNSTEEEILAPSVQNVDNGIWFARLKDNKTPEFVVDESAFGMAGLWAANGDTYTISSEGAFEFKTLEEPAAPTETGTFLMCSNPNTFTITLKQSAYILTTDGTSFEQEQIRRSSLSKALS